MALSASVLASAIKSAIDGVSDKTNRNDLFLAMATAIVDHIKNNGVITVTSVSGVTTGGGTSGPGTGTIA